MKRFLTSLMISMMAVSPAALADETNAAEKKAEIVEPKSTPAPRENPLTERQMDLVKQAEATFNAIQSMSARFIQSASTGDYSEGKVQMSKPGRLRIEYDPPIPVLVIANNDYFTFIDKEMDQRSYLSLDATPAGVLLREKVDLINSDIRVVDIQEDPGIATIVVTSKTDPTVGKLSLVFSKKPFAFRQWRVMDAQGITTTVTLQDMKTGVSFEKSLFKTPPRPKS